MTNIIMRGCNGRMGQVISGLVATLDNSRRKCLTETTTKTTTSRIFRHEKIRKDTRSHKKEKSQSR